MRYHRCDAHKRYSLFSPMDENDHFGTSVRTE